MIVKVDYIYLYSLKILYLLLKLLEKDCADLHSLDNSLNSNALQEHLL